MFPVVLPLAICVFCSFLGIGLLVDSDLPLPISLGIIVVSIFFGITIYNEFEETPISQERIEDVAKTYNNPLYKDCQESIYMELEHG